MSRTAESRRKETLSVSPPHTNPRLVSPAVNASNSKTKRTAYSAVDGNSSSRSMIVETTARPLMPKQRILYPTTNNITNTTRLFKYYDTQTLYALIKGKERFRAHNAPIMMNDQLPSTDRPVRVRVLLLLGNGRIQFREGPHPTRRDEC